MMRYRPQPLFMAHLTGRCGWGNQGGGRLLWCTEGVFHIRRDAAQVMAGERAREWHTDSTEDSGWEGKRMACGW